MAKRRAYAPKVLAFLNKNRDLWDEPYNLVTPGNLLSEKEFFYFLWILGFSKEAEAFGAFDHTRQHQAA